jgi:hypothetical protein
MRGIDDQCIYLCVDRCKRRRWWLLRIIYLGMKNSRMRLKGQPFGCTRSRGAGK